MKLNIFTEGDNVLLLGEGNFSFSRSLFSHQLPIKFTATCFDSGNRYKYQAENINFLKNNNIPVFLDVDATTVHEHPQLKNVRYSKVIFNFPHAGGKMKVQLNRELIKKVCMSSSKVLSNDGILILTLCNGQGGTPADNPQRRWDDSWQVIEMAAHGSFYLSSVEPFDFDNFPLYKCTGYRSQDSSFYFNGALVHIFRKRLLSSRFVDKATALQRLAYVPLCEGSTVLVPYYYSLLYSKNPLKNSMSCVSFFKEEILKLQNETNVKLKMLSDDDVPVCVNSKIGVSCSVNYKSEQRLRFSSLQVVGVMMERLNFTSSEILFFPGAFFNFQLGNDFTKVSPITFQYVLLGKSVSGYFSKFMEGLVKLFKYDNMTIYANVMSISTGSDDSHLWDVSSLFSHLNEYVSDCIKAIEWCCKLSNHDCHHVIAHEIHVNVKGKGVVEVFIVYVDKLIEVFFSLNSWKEVWSEGATVNIKSFPVLRQNVLYPSSYTFDITLKYNTDKDLDDDSVYEILRICAIELIADAQMINKYVSGAGWSSKCFRITYQSQDEPLYRQLVIDIQAKLIGKMLSLALPVTVK